jgi:DNA-directed RNA polymerase specialized sigma subunit
MAIGSYGLMEAMESYDASLDGDFATHAKPLIEQAMYGWLERDRIRRNRSAVSPSPAG